MARPKGIGVYRGYDKSRANGWYLYVASEGRRPKQYFATQKERDQAFAQKMGALRLGGIEAAAENITMAERQWLAEMRRAAKPTGLTPMEIFQRGLAQLGHMTVNDHTVERAHAIFMEEQALRFKENRISRSRFVEVRHTLRGFVAKHGPKPLGAVSRQIIKEHLLGLGVGPQTRLNRARCISFFFRWAIDEGWVLKNPVPKQEGVDRIPSVFDNTEVAALFRSAHEHFVELVPMLVLQWYAGLRPGASHQILWEHVDFVRGRILIHPDLNKMRQPDIVQDIPPTAFALLMPFRQESGRVAHSNHAKLTKAFHRKLGYHRGEGGIRWKEDVARHTFASNLVALYDQDLKRVSAVLLHAGSRTLLKHYLLKNVPRLEAERYFSVGLPTAN